MKAEWKDGKQIKQVLLNNRRPVGIELDKNGFAFQGEYKNSSFSLGQIIPITHSNRKYAIPFSQRLCAVVGNLVELPASCGQSVMWSNYTGTDQQIQITITPTKLAGNGGEISVIPDSTPYFGFTKYNRAKATLWQNAYYDFAVMFSQGKCFVIDKSNTSSRVSSVNITAGETYIVTLSIFNMKVKLTVEHIDNNGNVIDTQEHRFINLAQGYYTALFCSSHLVDIKDSQNFGVLTRGQTILLRPLVGYQNLYPLAFDTLQDNAIAVRVDSATDDDLALCASNDWYTREQIGVVNDNVGNAIMKSSKNPNYPVCAVIRKGVRNPALVSATVNTKQLNNVMTILDLNSYGEFDLVNDKGEKVITMLMMQDISKHGINSIKDIKLYGFKGDYALHAVKDYRYLKIGTYTQSVSDLWYNLISGFYTQEVTGSELMIVSDTNWGADKSLPYWCRQFVENGVLNESAMITALFNRIQDIVGYTNSAISYANENNWAGLKEAYDQATQEYEDANREFNSAQNEYTTAQSELNNYQSKVDGAYNQLSSAVNSYNSALSNLQSYSSSFDSALNSFLNNHSFSNVTNLTSSSMKANKIILSKSGNNISMESGELVTATVDLTVSGNISNSSPQSDRMLYNIMTRIRSNSTAFSGIVAMSDWSYREALSAAENVYRAYNQVRNYKGDVDDKNANLNNIINSYNTLVNNANSAQERYQNAYQAQQEKEYVYSRVQEEFLPVDQQFKSMMNSARDESNSIQNIINEFNNAVKWNNYDKYASKKVNFQVNGVSIKDSDTLSLIRLGSSIYTAINGKMVGNTISVSDAELHQLLLTSNNFLFTNTNYVEPIFRDETTYRIDNDIVQTTSSTASVNYQVSGHTISKNATNYTKIINNTPMKMNHISFRLGDDLSKEVYISVGAYSATPSYRTDARMDSTSYGIRFRFLNGNCHRYSGSSSSSYSVCSGLKSGDKVDLIIYLNGSNSLSFYLYVNGVYKTMNSNLSSISSGNFMSGLCIYSSGGEVSYYSNTSCIDNGNADFHNKFEICQNIDEGNISLTDIFINSGTGEPLANGVISDGTPSTSAEDLRKNKWVSTIASSGSNVANIGFNPVGLLTDLQSVGVTNAIDLTEIDRLELNTTVDSIKATAQLGFIEMHSGNTLTMMKPMKSEIGRVLINSSTGGLYGKPTKIRYIRDYINGNTKNVYGHWQEIRAYVRTHFDENDTDGHLINMACIAVNPLVTHSFKDGSGNTINPNNDAGILHTLSNSGMTTDSTFKSNAGKRSIGDNINSTKIIPIGKNVEVYTEQMTLRLNLISAKSSLVVGSRWFCHLRTAYPVQKFEFNDLELTPESNCFWSGKSSGNSKFPFEYFISVEVNQDHLSNRGGINYGRDYRFLDVIFDANLIVSGYETAKTFGDWIIDSADFQSYCSADSGDYHSFLDFNSSGEKYCEIDLGNVYDIVSLNIGHYYGDSRSYNGSRVEVSADKEHWVSIWDSSVDGTYIETDSGKTMYTNIGWSVGDVIGIRLERRADGDFDMFYVDKALDNNQLIPSSVIIPSTQSINGVAVSNKVIPFFIFDQIGEYILNPRLKVEYHQGKLTLMGGASSS